MKKVAIVGFGFMGRTHYGCWRKQKGAQVVAVCDSNLTQITATVQGNVKGAADNSALPKSVKVFADYEAMLAAGGFDIVDITLPTFLHPSMVTAALAKGYHVLCEKPMALNAKLCDTMLAAAKKARGKLMVAQCLRFWPEYVYLKDLITSGKFGKVVAAEFTRVSVAPGWGAKGKSWFLDEAKSGGVALDLHIHDADMVNFLFGLPPAVTVRSHIRKDGVTDHTVTTYEFKDKVVTAVGSWAASDTFNFEAGFRVIFENAVVVNDGKRSGGGLEVHPAGAKMFRPKLASRTGYQNEIAWFLAYVNGEVKLANAPLTPTDARNSVALIDAERRAAKTGKTTKV